MPPLAIDLFCGLGGWTDGLIAEGYYVVGFDIEQHDYGTGGYPAQLVLQDVLTLHGSQFRDAALIVASPPCQEYSYMAMPWSRAKKIEADYRAGVRDVRNLTALFDACFRIQREACEAAGHFIPLVVENVRGAQKWVGRSRWNFGSFHLWGDVPALMPMTNRAVMKGAVTHRPNDAPFLDFRKPPGFRFDGSGKSFQTASVEGQKTSGLVNIRAGARHTPYLTNQAEHDGVKVSGDWFGSYADMAAAGTISPGRLHGKGSKARKAASAAIAKIPFALASYIAQTYQPFP